MKETKKKKTTMSQQDDDQLSQKVAEGMSYFRNTQLRGEQAEEAYLEDWLNRLNNKQTQELNTTSASHLTKMPSEDMLEQMTLEDYKKKVEECLLKTYNCTTQETNRLMALYEDDFQEALSKFSWSPKTMALAMQKGY